MSRPDRRADYQSQLRQKTRGSILLDLAERDLLTDRQALAARTLERDREAAMGRSPGVQAFGARASGNGTFCQVLARETDASLRLRDLQKALPPSFRALYGKIERASHQKGTLAALAVQTGQKGPREDGLIKRGMVAAFLEACADFYGLPGEV